MRKSLVARPACGKLLFSVVLLLAAAFHCSAQNGQVVYKNYCAGCHGAQLKGSAGPALIKKEWKHGGDRNSLLRTIRHGIPSTEMMKFEGVLSAKEIEAVTDFILNVQTAPELVKKAELPLQVDTKLYKLKIEKLITEGLTSPWGIEFVDANHAFVTGKNGALYSLVNGRLNQQTITGLPKIYGTDLVGGMMDLALDPDYKTNGWIYIGFSHNPQNSPDKTVPGMTKIVRGKVRGQQWVEEQTLFQVHDSLLVTGGTRWGCRFLFDKQGHLYFTIGDMNRANDSQILSRPSGKIYRINPDGSIPKDNPLYGKSNDLQAIYSWGNRNVQGLAQHPATGVLYAS